MPRTKRPTDTPAAFCFAMTANQVVAHNLAQARAWRGWTQDEAAEALEPYLGARWSKANFSNAERSAESTRIRNFDADEIVAFAQGFELPVTFFFMPPNPSANPGIPVMLERAGANGARSGIARLIDLVFGEPEHIGILALRLQAFLDHTGSPLLTESQARIQALVDARLAQLASHAHRRIHNWTTWLRTTANQLEDLDTQARQATRTDLGLNQDHLPDPGE